MKILVVFLMFLISSAGCVKRQAFLKKQLYESLLFDSNKWKEDSLGCGGYRAPFQHGDLIKDVEPMFAINKFRELKFTEAEISLIFGKPNYIKQEIEIGRVVWVYYLEYGHQCDTTNYIEASIFNVHFNKKGRYLFHSMMIF
jgi:hypothetical protein